MRKAKLSSAAAALIAVNVYINCSESVEGWKVFQVSVLCSMNQGSNS